MITNIIEQLKAEQAAGNRTAEEIGERIDAHIRDLQLLKAWVFDHFATRAIAIDMMVGEKMPATTNTEQPGDTITIADEFARMEADDPAIDPGAARS